MRVFFFFMYESDTKGVPRYTSMKVLEMSCLHAFRLEKASSYLGDYLNCFLVG